LHRVIHAQNAAFQVDQGTHFFKQVPGAELLTIEKTIGRIVGEVSAAHLRESHAPGALGLGQKKGRVMFQRAFRRRWLAERAHRKGRQNRSKLPKIKIYSA
jgi:hypothetical protein